MSQSVQSIGSWDVWTITVDFAHLNKSQLRYLVVYVFDYMFFQCFPVLHHQSLINYNYKVDFCFPVMMTLRGKQHKVFSCVLLFLLYGRLQHSEPAQRALESYGLYNSHLHSCWQDSPLGLLPWLFHLSESVRGKWDAINFGEPKSTPSINLVIATERSSGGTRGSSSSRECDEWDPDQTAGALTDCWSSSDS